MARHEKLILLVVALFLLAKAGTFALPFYFAMHYGPLGALPYDGHLWRSAAVIWGGAVNIGAAVWLAVEARVAARSLWVWALFGLCFGLLAVALFYLVQLHAQRNVQKT